ncbi:hypothetical protein Tco_0761817, partial [Tanacetum coccineum]
TDPIDSMSSSTNICTSNTNDLVSSVEIHPLNSSADEEGGTTVLGSCIPDVGSNGCTTVLDAVGSFVAWPKNQVVFDQKATPPSTIQMITVENKTAPKVPTKRKNFYVSSDAMQKEANKKRSQKALHWRSGFFFIDRRAIPNAMVWRHPDAAIDDPRPAAGSFNVADVCRLSAHVVKLRDMPKGVLVLSRLSQVWKSHICNPVLWGADGNVMDIHNFLCLPEWTSAEVQEEPHLDVRPTLQRLPFFIALYLMRPMRKRFTMMLLEHQDVISMFGSSSRRVKPSKEMGSEILPSRDGFRRFFLQPHRRTVAEKNNRKARTLLLMAVPKGSSQTECKFKGTKDGSRQEASRGQDFKPVRTEKEALMTIDEGQINWVEQTTDEELNHALMAFTVNNEVSMCSKLCLDSFNALKAKYDELQSEFGDQEAALVAHKLAVKKLESQLKASHKQQSSLNEKLNFQANQIFEKDEKLKKYRRIGMKAVKDKDALQKIVDSWFASSKNLWKLIDCGMSSTVKIGLGYGIKSNAEVLGYEEEISRGIFAFRETNAGYNDIPLYSRFKQVEYKGVPHPLSGDYTPREQEDIDDSLYEYGKYGPQPQSPSPTVSNASSIVFSICPSNDSDGELGAVSDANSTVYSTCQSNDSDGEQGTVSDHSVNDDPIPIPSIEQVTIVTQKTQPQVPKPQQTVDPSCAQHVKTPRQPIRTPVTPSPIPSNNRQNWNQRMERDLGTGYSFYEKKMARKVAFKSTRVVHTDVRQATPAWTNTNRGRIDIGDIKTDAEITLIDETHGRINDIIADEDITLIPKLIIKLLKM